MYLVYISRELGRRLFIIFSRMLSLFSHELPRKAARVLWIHFWHRARLKRTIPEAPPANPNAPLLGYGNLAPAYVVPTWYAPLARPVRCPRQPRQRSTSAAPSCARHRARQLKKKILNTFPTNSGCFVLGCQCFVARIYCDEQ